MTTYYTSYSALGQHRACPQRFLYSRIRNLEKVDPDDVRVELEFGNWWHALRAADSIERGRSLGSIQYVPDTLSPTDDIEIPTTGRHLPGTVYGEAHAWWDRQTPFVQETWVGRLGESLPERLAYVDARWREQHAYAMEHEEPLGVEVKWRRDLPSVGQHVRDGGEPEMVNPDTAMVGYIDEVYYDTQRRIVVVRDHKTSKTLGTQSVIDDMMDSQLQVYAWGASPLITGWGRGPIRAVAYDRVRTVKPTEPSLTKSGRLTVRDGQPSISNCDLHTYRTWAYGVLGTGVPYEGLKKDGSAAGFYHEEPEIVERLSTPQAQSIWFQRTLTPLNRNVVETHLRSAVDTALDVVQTRVRAEISGQAGRNLTAANCRWCDFASLCRAEMVGGAGGEYDLAEFKLREKN